jgi:hypothetical protein
MRFYIHILDAFEHFKSVVVALYTTRFNIEKIYLALRSVFVCFVWISEQTAIISLYSIN